MKLSIEFVELDKEFIARCPELDVNSYGTDKDEAIRRLVSVIQFYIESAKEVGLEVKGLSIVSIDGKPTPASFKEAFPLGSEAIN